MSGHSKWATIKHQKAAKDAKRGSTFTQLGNAVTVAAKQGGGDPVMNASLRLAIDKARAANMPKDNIERAIKRGTGELGGAVVEELLFEGFGPANVAILIEALSDNRNRTTPEVRLIMGKNGGRMAETGVAYQFTQRGVLRLDVPVDRTDAFEEALLETEAEDYRLSDEYAVVFVSAVQLHQVKDQLDVAGFAVDSAKIEYVPNSPVEVEESDMERVAKLLEVLESNDDVTNVYTNLAE
jgi:YebC/PmpR family DNA-binding regulatory protein